MESVSRTVGASIRICFGNSEDTNRPLRRELRLEISFDHRSTHGSQQVEAIPQSAPLQPPNQDRAPQLPDSPRTESQAIRGDVLAGLDSLSAAASGGTRESFGVCNSDPAIESVVLSDNRNVRELLGEGLPPLEIARLAGEGIREEGLRCLEGASEGEIGNDLCTEMIAYDTI
jgi:hypothetical protein